MSLKPAAALQRRSLAGLLLCAMLLMQLASLWHGIAHAQGPGHSAGDVHATRTEPPGLDALFGQHDDGPDCQVFDQLTHADAPGWARPSSRVEHPAVSPSRERPAPDIAAWVSGLHARGPPARG